MKLAYEKGYGRIWVMDNDAMTKSDAVEKLLVAIARLGDQNGKSCLW